MNKNKASFDILHIFLNGVCRHEQRMNLNSELVKFLNGVCRHELGRIDQAKYQTFLNGVCRHEL